MGLLDDAIREHLDLKRRRGADPSEIAREEHDALGPVRRGEPAADDELAPAHEPDDGPHADGSIGAAGAGLDDPAAAYDDDVDYDSPGYDEPAAAYEPPVPAEPPGTHADPYAGGESESATPPHGDPLMHQPTREFSSRELDEALGDGGTPAPPPASERLDEEPETVPADEAGGEDEDVLEETPDFLQETPEHDRLWFEQKPPKDFDF